MIGGGGIISIDLNYFTTIDIIKINEDRIMIDLDLIISPKRSDRYKATW